MGTSDWGCEESTRTLDDLFLKSRTGNVFPKIASLDGEELGPEPTTQLPPSRSIDISTIVPCVCIHSRLAVVEG